MHEIGPHLTGRIGPQRATETALLPIGSHARVIHGKTSKVGQRRETGCGNIDKTYITTRSPGQRQSSQGLCGYSAIALDAHPGLAYG